MGHLPDRSSPDRRFHRSRAAGGLLAVLAALGLAGCEDEETLGTGAAGGAGGTGGAGGATTSDTSTNGGAGGGTTTQPTFTNPPVCDPAVCPLVPNESGSNTRAVTLAAKGGTRDFDVPGAVNPFHVSTYNDSLPGPTIEMTTTASDPVSPTEADFLLFDVTNEGALNLCCWQSCSGGGDACWPEYCQGLPLGMGQCEQVDGETNIHTHGLHIAGATQDGGSADACVFNQPDPASPDLPWDNVFITIPASGMAENMSCSETIPMCMIGNQQSFVYPLPPHASPSSFQPSATVYPHWFGLDWYHPHMHPTTQDQVQRGMAGALVVRNPAEQDIPVLAGLGPDSEKILVLQSIPDDAGQANARLVNGLQNPVMTLQPGATQRFRVLNATADTAIQISFVNAADRDDVLAFHPIGFDGVPVPNIFPALYEQYLLPGNRLEFLFTIPPDAAEGDTYNLTWCEPSFSPVFNLVDNIPGGQCTGTTLTAVTLRVSGAPATPTPFETGDTFADLESFGLVPDLWDPGVEVAVQRTIKYTQDGSDFFLDTGEGPQMFSMEEMCNVPIGTTLDSVEEWTLENYTGDLHTFHLHVNPVQVDPNEVIAPLGPYPFYQDNILVPAGTGFCDPMEPGCNPNQASTPGTVTIRFRPTDYVGTSVFHCHVLFHEDHGMMATFTTLQ